MATFQRPVQPNSMGNTSMQACDVRKLNKTEKVRAKMFLENHSAQIYGMTATGPILWLTVSPYPEDEHLLELNSLDTHSRLLALASTKLEPATENYATARYEDAIDWTSLMFTLKSLAAQEGYKWTRHEFYVVEFRSKLKKNIDVDRLFRLDKESHAEATKSGGLLKYWYGVPDVNRRNLATCLWRNKEDATEGGRGPWHKQARAAISSMYEEIDVKGFRLVIEDDVKSWSFETFK